MVGECEDGHLYAIDLGGRREWCPTCGGRGGPAHQRRKARWMPKARQLRSMGYLVVTIPPELRQQYRNTQELSHLGTALKRGLQRLGFGRGLYCVCTGLVRTMGARASARVRARSRCSILSRTFIQAERLLLLGRNPSCNRPSCYHLVSIG